MKTGAMHLDWMVSMGIFLLLVLSIFIFFKPGAEPAYSKNYLLPIIENNFKKSVYYSIERIPISAENINIESEGITFLELDFAGNFPVCNADTIKYNVVDSSSFDDINFKIVDLDCGTKSGKIQLKPNNQLITGNNNIKFYLLYSDNFTTDHSGKFDCRTTIVDGNPKNCVPVEGMKMGVSEIITGLNKKILVSDHDLDGNDDGGYLNYINDNYATIKTEWNYPMTKEFKICKDSLEDFNCYPKNSVKKIPDDVNVFAREFNELVLNENTELGSNIIINVRAW